MRLLAALAVLLLPAAARAAEAPVPLGLREAISAALTSRLDVIDAREQAFQARSQALENAASLLPHLTATLAETRTYRINLAAEGLSFPGFPMLLGPYDTFDARAHLTQTLFDWGSWRRAQSGAAAARAAGEEEKAVREQVASAAALAYLEAARAQRAVAAASADKELADRLLALARDRKVQGSATGVDVVRARARDADAEAALLRARISDTEAQLLLKRVVGWPLGREIRLTDDFTAVSSTIPALDSSLTAAFAGRAEIPAAEDRARAETLAAQAAAGDRAPSIVLMGDYARSGTVPSDTRGVGDVGGALAFPVFSGGLLKGRQEEARSRERQALAELADVRQQVELDVRTSIERLSEAAAEEGASELSLSLAARELAMAQDRFSAGVGDPLDVIEAQAELARARSEQVSALARYHSSRVNYAAAIGRAVDFSL
ncbi:MAG TPA: TolC family protein [Elusimicrobiota bacterium]|jgi:outer membrane protein TolC|nr:TolC family protein [Elusimicrobiota bacterium]